MANWLSRQRTAGLIEIIVLVAGLWASAVGAADQPLYMNASQPVDARVNDLISKMTLDEKASQMFHGAPPIERLGVSAVKGWNQCLRGVVWSKPTTMFPVPIAQAATWDTALVHDVANAISDEARGIYNLTRGTQNKKGLFYRAPVINISRDPRWGRIEECYGEDPFLTSRIGVAFVKGLQGDDPKYLKLVSTLKHFAVNNQEVRRTSLSAVVDERMLHEYWLPHFKACIVEGQAQSIMAAYNAINGVPCAVNKMLLTDILKKQWGFEGFVVSDTGGINHLVNAHRMTTSYEEAAAKAVLAGCDLDDQEYPKYLPNAVKMGLLTEKDIDSSLTRILRARFRLGEFDPPNSTLYDKISPDVVDSREHRDLAGRAARESIVLLTNKSSFLPLDKGKIKSIAVIGPHADAFVTGCSWYTGSASNPVKPIDGIKAKLPAGVDVLYAKGCDFARKDFQRLSIQEAVDTAKKADVVVLFLGTNSSVENESIDRTSLALPGAQEDLAKAVYAVNPRTVLVLMNAGPLAIKWEKDNIPAVLQAWFPGEECGNAIADVIFGDYNPAGRLPYTVYESLDQIPPQTEYDVTKGFTYMYFKSKPLFPFGHGLSYTSFKYGKLSLSSKSITTKGSVDVSLDVRNTGKREGDEVVQLYVRDVECPVVRPVKELRGFQRVRLKPGESAKLTFSLPAEKLAYYDVKSHGFVVDPGAYDVMVGASSDDIRSKARIDVTGDRLELGP